MTGTQADTQAVIVERDYPHPPDRVWRALTLPHLIAEWLMRNDFRPVLGHRFTLHGDWGGVMDCEILAVEPHRTLSYRWTHAHDDPAQALDSVVTFTLVPIETGTRLRVEHAGFGPGQRQAHRGARAGWPRFLTRLEAMLARPDDTTGQASLLPKDRS